MALTHHKTERAVEDKKTDNERETLEPWKTKFETSQGYDNSIDLEKNFNEEDRFDNIWADSCEQERKWQPQYRLCNGRINKTLNQHASN